MIDIAVLRSLLAAATERPWFVDQLSQPGYTRICNGKGCEESHVNCDAVVSLDGGIIPIETVAHISPCLTPSTKPEVSREPVPGPWLQSANQP